MKKNKDHNKKFELTLEKKEQVDPNLEEYDFISGGNQAMPTISFTKK